jgi:putative ABC transport system substrate-binding protein
MFPAWLQDASLRACYSLRMAQDIFGRRNMRRRELLALIGGAAAAWPLAGGAQQSARTRRVVVLMLYAESDPQGQARAASFRQGLESAGWVPGRNIAVDYLWGAFSPDWTRNVTTELGRLTPDVIVVNTSTALQTIQTMAATTPIVFIGVSEPVARGYVASLSHPGGNTTGLSNLEPTVGAKWIDLLKQIAPQVKRVAFMYNPGNPGSSVGLESAQSVASQFSVDVTDTPVSDLAAIEAVITALGREPGGALVLPPDPFTSSFRKPIGAQALALKLPTVSAVRAFVDEGGLLTYGVSIPGLFRQAAGYVDRILRGEKPANMPVEQPTRFEMVINLKTARALGLSVPASLLATVDEVIE